MWKEKNEITVSLISNGLLRYAECAGQKIYPGANSKIPIGDTAVYIRLYHYFDYIYPGQRIMIKINGKPFYDQTGISEDIVENPIGLIYTIEAGVDNVEIELIYKS